MWNRCGDDNQIANRHSKMKSIRIKKEKADEEKVKKHTQIQRLGFCDSARVKRLRQIGAEIVQDSKASI